MTKDNPSDSTIVTTLAGQTVKAYKFFLTEDTSRRLDLIKVNFFEDIHDNKTTVNRSVLVEVALRYQLMILEKLAACDRTILDDPQELEKLYLECCEVLLPVFMTLLEKGKKLIKPKA